MANSTQNTPNKPNIVQRFLRNNSESSDASASDFGSFQDMIDGETTTTRPRAGSVNLSISRDIAPMRPRFGSVNSKDMMTMEANKKETALENMLYDKYRAK